MSAEVPRQMTDEEYGILPEIELSIDGRRRESVFGGGSEWLGSQPSVHDIIAGKPSMQGEEALAADRAHSAFRFLVRNFLPDLGKPMSRGPRINVTNATYYSEMTPDVTANDQYDSSLVAELAELLPIYGDRPKNVSSVLILVEEAVKKRRESRKAEYVRKLNSNLDDMSGQIVGGLWVATTQFGESGIRLDTELPASLALVDSFALVPDTGQSAYENRFSPNIQPLVSVKGEKVLLPDDVLVMGATIKLQESKVRT